MLPRADKGFTLLEVMLALVLTAILAAMAGAGVVSGFNLFTAARDNTHITQKANLALTRLTRELREITKVHGLSADPLYLIYEKVTPSTCSAVALNDDTIKLFSGDCTTLQASMNVGYIADPDNGNILIDNLDTVNGFSLDYYSSHPTAGDNIIWQSSDPIRELSAIEFEFTIARDSLGGRDATFGNTVYLRNNNNYGGAALTVTPPIPPTQSSYPCFIDLAGSGAKAWSWRPFVLIYLLPLVLLSARRQQRVTPSALPESSNAKGAALITVVVVLVVFSALAIIMLPMITTSQYTQLGQDAAGRAYYLAESGYRYAASEYLNAGSDSAKNTALKNLHGKDFTLSGGAGSFHLDVYPYFGYVKEIQEATNTLIITLPGDLSADLADDGSGNNAFSGGGRLRIGPAYFSYDSADTDSPPDISFHITGAMPSVPVDTDVYFAGQTRTDDKQTVYFDGTDAIEMAAGSTDTFPLYNGEVVINDNVYAYRENIRDTNPAKLDGITDPEDPSAPSLDLDPGTDVFLSKFVDLKSTGSVGDGTLTGERLLTYHVPLPTSQYAQHRLEFHDTFENLDHWKTVWGTQAVHDYGGNAMSIESTRTDNILGFPRISLAALDWRDTQIDLEWIHQRADYFLSYDAQVKIGFKDTDLPETPTPEWGFRPPGTDIPFYFAAGISFRLDLDVETLNDNHNAYGLSILRGSNDINPPDNLPGDILDPSFYNKLVLLLWQQINAGSNRTWLAYKQIGDLEVFSEDVESDTSDWTINTPWETSTSQPHGGAVSFHFNRDGVTSDASLISPEITDSDYGYLWLSYYSRHEKAAGDVLSVEYRSFDGTTWSDPWSEIDRITANSHSTWERREIVVAVTCGEPVQLRFRYDTDTTDPDSYAGWFVDDIRILGYWPVEDATVALRIQEAPSLEFTSGGPYEIKPGDQIYQGEASATVDASPIVTAGSWTGGDAAGHLVLKNLSGTFGTGDGSGAFYVLGHGEVGTFAGSRERDNFIRVYYGSAAGCRTFDTNTDPDILDHIRLANERDPEALHWPPVDGEDTTAENDYFTLIQWDAVNTNNTFVWDPFNEQNVRSITLLTSTQLRSDERDLLTDEGPLGQTRAELGLHALGRGAENTYFDDFGLSVTFKGPVDITSPLQE